MSALDTTTGSIDAEAMVQQAMEQFDPEASSSDIKKALNLTQAKAAAEASNVMTRLGIIKSIQGISAINSDRTGAIAAAANADIISSSAKNALLAETEAKKSATQTQANINPLTAGNRYTQYINEMNENADKAKQVADVIHAKQQVTLFSNPLEYISNQFTLPSDVETHNYYATAHNRAEENLAGLTRASTLAAQEIEATKQTTNAAIALAETQKIAALAKDSIDKVKIDNLTTQWQGFAALNQITNAQLNQSLQVDSNRIAAAHLDVATRNAEDTHKMRELQYEMRSDDISMRDLYAKQYAIGAATQGLPPLPWQAVMAGLKDKNNPNIAAYVAIGADVQANGNSATGIPLAQNSGAAAILLAKSGVKPSGINAPATSLLLDTYAQFKENPANVAVKDPVAIADLVKKELDKKANDMMNSVDEKDSKNIYNAPPSATIISLPMIATSSSKFLGETVKSMVATAPEVNIPPSVLLGTAISTVRKNPALLEDTVKGITEYYGAAKLYNNSSKGIVERGLPPQAGFKAKVQFGIMNNNVNLDLTDPLVVKRLLMVQSRGMNPMFDFGQIAQPSAGN